ncbi:MAG TPA: efflux RND transporter periplasmic adaptor subunit, partial [Chitinophagales bacterium]|nr:efflux RND transporter periplasmic adaptor subunit [Chitinophagales bacterium]
MKFLKILSVIAIVAVIAGCKGNVLDKKKKELAEAKADVKDLNTKIESLEKEIATLDTTFKVEQKAKLVQVGDVKKETFRHYIEVQGFVDAEQNVTALCQQPGIVSAVYVKLGEHVTKGQLLAITETTSAVEDQLRAAQVQLSLATTAYEKQKNLWDQKIGSEIQYLQVKTQKEAAEKNVDALKKQLEMTKVIAPIDGVVDQVNLRIGDMAAPSQLMPGIRIVNAQSLKVKAKLADTDYGKVKAGDKVQVEFPDINKTIEATVSYVSQTIDT